MKYVEKIVLENPITNQEHEFQIGYCVELDSYIMALNVPWIACYHRYYRITEEDYHLHQTEKEKFLQKYQAEISQNPKTCFNENFLGAAALRDYDGANGFQKYFQQGNDKNVFQHYAWLEGALFARICFTGADEQRHEILVPPVRAIPNEDQSGYQFPLRRLCRILADREGKTPLCFAYKGE